MRVGRAGRPLPETPPAKRFLMFARMLMAAALVLGTGVAFASDASYDQEQLREGKLTLVEGGLRPVAKAAPSEKAAPAVKAASSSKTGHTMVCSCSR
jgi:hypothetical protein